MSRAPVAVAAALLIVSTLLAQGTSPPPSTEEIVAAFEKAVPELFDAIVKAGPAPALGEANTGDAYPCSSNLHWFSFMECTEQRPPRLVSYDVKKTDSLLTPVLGLMNVDVSEFCRVRYLVGGPMMTAEKFDPLKPHCLGKTYDQCKAAGGKKTGIGQTACLGGGSEISFTFNDVIEMSYRWSKGKWEFEKEKTSKPRRPEKAAT